MQTQTQTQRGSYGEIPFYTLDAETRERVAALVEAAAGAAGWHKVVSGRRASFWTFAAPTID